MPQDPGFLGLCPPHSRPLRPVLGPRPPVHSVPMPTTKTPATSLAAQLSLHTPQAMPVDTPPGPSIAKVLSHLPNLPDQPACPPAPLAAPWVLPAPSNGTPRSCLQSSRAALGHQGHSRHPEPPLPSTAIAGSPPQPTRPGWTAPRQSPALRRRHTALWELRGGG